MLLLGSGETRKNIEGLANSLDVNRHILFAGNVNNVGDYLSAMDVFAFPSKYEGMPLSLIEAQANGLPCIISDKIPKDVYLSDLIIPLPINEIDKGKWINRIVYLERADSIKYYSIINNAGFSVDEMLKNIYGLYDGGH